MNAPAPIFACAITYKGHDDQRVIMSIWVNPGEEYCTVWSSSTLPGNFREHRIHCGEPPRDCGHALWSLINVLGAMVDSGWRGFVTLMLQGEVDEPGFVDALFFVNKNLPMPETADIDDLC